MKLPRHWEVRSFGELMDLERGTELPKSNYVYEPALGYIRLLQIHDYEHDKKPAYIRRAARSSRCTESDILIARSGASLGRVCRGMAGAYSSALAKVVIKDEKLLPEFAYHWFCSDKFQVALRSVGSRTAQEGLSRADLLPLPFNLPPFDEQTRIAKILDSVDEAIRATQEVVRQTRKVTNAALTEIFTGRTGHTDYKPVGGWRIGKLPIDAIPRSWSVTKVVDVARLESGHTPNKKVSEYWGGNIPWLSLHDTKGLSRRIILETAQKTTELGIRNSSARILPSGTVAVSRAASIGLCVIMGCEMATSQDFANFVCGERINNIFLMHLFRFIAPILVELSSGSAHKSINMSIFEQLQIALPPLHEQITIARTVDAFFDAIEAGERQIRQLVRLKSALMSDLLTGRKQVTTDLLALEA